MRQCRTCGESKPLMDFYSQTNGSLQRDCKECWKSYVKANRLARADQYREYERGRANLPHRVEARQRYSQTPEGKAAHQRAHRTQNARNPIKRAARVAAGNAIRDGRLVRRSCEVCGAEKSQAHHDDYSKPLDVRWLCTTHHAEWHKENEAIVHSVLRHNSPAGGGMKTPAPETRRILGQKPNAPRWGNGARRSAIRPAGCNG